VPVIRIETFIQAPPEQCFDLARNVEAHVASTAATGERAVSAVASYLKATLESARAPRGRPYRGCDTR
jgi:hypothetical protein